MANFMAPADFNKMFVHALTDETFQKELMTKGFQALEAHGYQHGVPPDVKAHLDKVLFQATGGTTARKPRCGVCGVCGVCGLCGEVNFGSASAALWALFGLALQ
jgi:hypothetical protein